MQERGTDNRRPAAMARPQTERPRSREPGVPQNRPQAGGQMSRKHTFLTKYYEPVRGSFQEDARTGHRIYRLKGYTTVDKINRKFQQERNQRTLRNILTFLMIVILLVVLIAIYNPFTNLDEWKKISGEDSLYNKQKEPTTTQRILDFP
jgi:hypothetical protein